MDEFIAELWQVHLKVKEEGYVQVCTHFRSMEYLFDKDTESFFGSF